MSGLDSVHKTRFMHKPIGLYCNGSFIGDRLTTSLVVPNEYGAARPLYRQWFHIESDMR